MSARTDRELLELAAKAAGIVVKRSRLDDPAMLDILIATNRDSHSTYIGWNPLTDDGDAMRLAVKLNMDFTLSGKHAAVAQAGNSMTQEYCNGDPYAAARRAIVRAAAEIGGAA